MENLTSEQLDAKAAELKEKFKCEITPIQFTDKKTGEQIVGYLREIQNYQVLMFAIGKMMNNAIEEGAEAILNHCLVREESNMRILSEQANDVFIKASAVLACVPQLQIYANEYKKK